MQYLHVCTRVAWEVAFGFDEMAGGFGVDLTDMVAEERLGNGYLMLGYWLYEALISMRCEGWVDRIHRFD